MINMNTSFSSSLVYYVHMHKIDLLSKGLHECTSSLTVVLGYIQMLQKDLADDPSRRNKKRLIYLREATKACKNIQDIIQEIKPQ